MEFDFKEDGLCVTSDAKRRGFIWRILSHDGTFSMATAQTYYPYYYPGYSYHSPGYSYYSVPGWSYPVYSYPAYSYPYGHSAYYGWPYAYPAPAYRPAPAYSDAYVAARPYSDSAGPRASGHVGY
jgi:hypothetical protein